MERKVLVDGEYIKPISKSELHRIQKTFKKNGGLILVNAETDAYLESCGAQGITYNAQIVLLSSNATRAAVFEELIHTAQYRDGQNDGSLASRIQCEIEAKEKLLKHAKAYKLTTAEIRETKKLLAQDKQDMLEYR